MCGFPSCSTCARSEGDCRIRNTATNAAHHLAPISDFCIICIVAAMSSIIKKPKPTPLMKKFYDNIEYFQEEVVGKKDVPLSATDQTNIVQDNEELVDDEIPTKVLDQVKLVCRWRGNCKLCGPSNGHVITDVMGTLSNFSKHLTKVHGTNKDYIS